MNQGELITSFEEDPEDKEILVRQNFLSLEDDLMRIFGSDKLDSVLKTLGLSDGESIQHPWITKALGKSTKKS